MSGARDVMMRQMASSRLKGAGAAGGAGGSIVGAWGIGVFENDDAMDWAVHFQHAPSEQSLRDAFGAVIGVESYLERDPCGYALAAAEVLAAARGKPCRDIPQPLRDWAAANPGVATPTLLAQALAAIDRVTLVDSSELAELWVGTKEAADWLNRIDDLRRRLI
jgi:hypothetical protein